MKRLISFLITFLTVFGCLSIFSYADAVENPVVPNGTLGEFRHGTFPSPPLGDFTHVGVDIVAPCGSDIYAFADGKVRDIIVTATL